jgi:DNA-binding NarL/FixJ family response regulator
MGKLKVILADDHIIFRQGLASLLNKGIADVVAEASNGAELLEIIPKFNPDLVLMDISMPVMDGIEATRIISEKFPGVKVLALSMFGDQEYYHQMIHAGAKGFVIKSSGINELEKAINEIASGESYFSNELLRKIISNFSPTDNDSVSTINIERKLSVREIEVLQLICAGFTNIEIAEKLNISETTAKGHRNKILQKTACKNTANLVMHAIKSKIIVIN